MTIDARQSAGSVLSASPRGTIRESLSTLQGRVGAALMLFMLLFIIVGPYLAPYDPTMANAGPPLEGPSGAHWLGTDALGRDVLSRLLAGGRTILAVPVIATAVAYVLGGGMGLWSAYRGGVWGALVVRVFDALVTLPGLMLILVIISGFGPGAVVLVFALSLSDIPRCGRIIRGAAQSVVANDYIAAAESRGERTCSILRRELMPNVATSVLADLPLRLTYAIIAMATLSFLGLGVQPPTPNWGLMIAENQAYLEVQPFATLAPSLGVAVLSVSFSVLAESVSRQISRRGSRAW